MEEMFVPDFVPPNGSGYLL